MRAAFRLLLWARKREVRAQLASLRKLHKQRLRELRAAQRNEGRQRKRWRLAALLVLLALALLLRCRCDEGPARIGPPAVAAPAVRPPPPPAAKKPKRRAPLQGRVVSQSRGAYPASKAVPHPWLDSFRLQVTSRSPRLAHCLQGSEKPGALRWSCEVDPAHGTVANQVLEPVGNGVELTGEQRACLMQVLSQPAYALKEGDMQSGAPSTPVRVGLVVEF